MATIIRSADAPHSSRVADFNFDDIMDQAGLYLARAKTEGAEIVAQAGREAESIRREAEEAGRRAALQEVETMVAEQTAPALQAMRRAAADLQSARGHLAGTDRTTWARLLLAATGAAVRARFESSEPVTAAGQYSELTVVWFQEEWALPVDYGVRDLLTRLDWDGRARDMVW